jgi:type II secretory pathway pseudopilin PulG
MRQNNFFKTEDSFTLVELLIVIGILAILTAAVVIVLNPAELLKQSRDSKRTTDLASLNNAIKLLLTQNPDVNLGTASTIYVSLADSSSTCGSYSLPSVPAGWQYRCATAANYQKTDGSGWVPVSFAAANTVASLPTLPIDPQNAGIYYYSYIPGGSWAIASLLESEKYGEKARSDAGVDPDRLEVGSNLALWKDPYGLVGYWPFDEGSGPVAGDASGRGSTGSLMSSSLWQGGTECEIGACVQFSGSNYVNIPSLYNANFPQSGTISFWIKSDNWGTAAWAIVDNYDSARGHFFIRNNYSYPGQIQIRFQDSAGYRFGGEFPVSAAKWNLISVAWDTANMKGYIYMNGTLIVSGAIGSGWTPAGQRMILGEGGFVGLMDDLRLYNRVLSAAEIQAVYNATK